MVACDSSITSRKSFGKKSSSVKGFEPGGRPDEMPRVILDPVAEAHLLQHLEIVFGAHFQALRFEQFALRFELNDPLVELGRGSR